MKNKNSEEKVKNGYLYKKVPSKLFPTIENCYRCCFLDCSICKKNTIFSELQIGVCNEFYYTKTQIVGRDKNGRFVSKKENTIAEQKQVAEKPMRYFFISYILKGLDITIGYLEFKNEKYPSEKFIKEKLGVNAIPLCITELSEQDYKDFLK